jgi:hypothetical protein
MNNAESNLDFEKFNRIALQTSEELQNYPSFQSMIETEKAELIAISALRQYFEEQD